jgi:hypothetical protein
VKWILVDVQPIRLGTVVTEDAANIVDVSTVSAVATEPYELRLRTCCHCQTSSLQMPKSNKIQKKRSCLKISTKANVLEEREREGGIYNALLGSQC